MSFRLPLQPVANQSFSSLLDDINYRLTIKETRGVMSVSISLDEIGVISGSRFFTDSFLIPYPHLEGAGGNFIFTSEGDAIPDFEQFDVTQFLFYVTAAEVADARS